MWSWLTHCIYTFTPVFGDRHWCGRKLTQRKSWAGLLCHEPFGWLPQSILRPNLAIRRPRILHSSTAASGTLPWPALGWGCRCRRLSRERGSLGKLDGRPLCLPMTRYRSSSPTSSRPLSSTISPTVSTSIWLNHPSRSGIPQHDVAMRQGPPPL